MSAVVVPVRLGEIRHAAVSGASGFVGRQLCRALQQSGVEITALHRHSSDGPWQHQQLVDLGATEAFRLPETVDSVFHLAGFAHAEDEPGAQALHQAVTAEGTARLLNACPRTVRRFTYFSSVKAMGESTTNACVDETCVPRPTTAYGRARWLAEQHVLGFSDRMHTSVLRLPLVYGPGVKGNLARLLRAVRSRRLPILPEFGNRRSMVHVDDVVSAALLTMGQPVSSGRVYLLCDGQRYSTRQIQLCMYHAVGIKRPLLQVPKVLLQGAAFVGDALSAIGVRRVPISTAALEKLEQSACYDATRARDELTWRPQHTLADALPAMLKTLDS